jgi:PRTRC genetic system ThiF family protein
MGTKQKIRNPEMARRKALEYLNAACIRLPPGHDWDTVALIGCGGTGGWLAPALARIAYILKRKEKEISLMFVDPDIVEEVNIGRQNFCQAEIGRNKAEALAERYGTAWGVEIEAIPRTWEEANKTERVLAWESCSLIVGCVDNAKARASIVRELRNGSVFWIDCGNHEASGQVLLGNVERLEEGARAFPSKKMCVILPAPHVQEPTLLVPRRGENGKERLSCAELAALNAQSLAINQRVAAEAADMIGRLLVTHDLKRFAAYFDMDSGTASSVYAVKENVMRFARKKRRSRG